MASVYWVRSLVPTEKKSTSCANTSAISAAEGTSIIIPTSMGGAFSSTRTSSTIARALRSSLMSATMGNMMRRWPYAAARKMARSC